MRCKRFLIFVFSSVIGLSYAFSVGDLFDDFIQTYNKRYDASHIYKKRLENFKASLQRSQLLNRQRTHIESAYYGITQFSDLTPEEFKALFLKNVWQLRKRKPFSGSRKIRSTSNEFKNLTGVPEKTDWRDKNVVTKVKNQKKCGACWAFSTIETIETMNALKGHSLKEFSVQQMIDCAENGNYGCNGGDTCSSLMWLSKKNISVVTEEEYPYQDKAGKCSIKKFSPGVRIADNFTCDNYTYEEGEIVRILAQHGPVTAAVDATGWQDYLGGIIQFHCETNRNHAVQIVGYDTSGDVPYYIVRNSWGTAFGINGYLHIAIGGNVCGIAQDISSITIK